VIFLLRGKMTETFIGYLEGNIQKAKNAKNIELEMFFSDILKKFKEFYPRKIIRNEIKIIDGWKGVGTTEIYRGFIGDFRIVEYIKDKETGEIEETYKDIKKEDVNKMILIVKSLEIGTDYKCYYIANKMGWNWKDLWRERQIYFKTYYYPIKILEALKIIMYGGRGTITRLI
jgi:hypothetical protein